MLCVYSKFRLAVSRPLATSPLPLPPVPASPVVPVVSCVLELYIQTSGDTDLDVVAWTLGFISIQPWSVIKLFGLF